MSFERVQAAAPELSIGGKPPIHVGERLGPQPVEASLTLRTHADEAGVTQDAQVLRHPRLADLEPVDQLSNGPFALAEEVKDAPALRLGEDVEGGVHGVLDYSIVICLPSDIALKKSISGKLDRMRSATALTAAVIASLTTTAAAQAAHSITADPVRVDQTATQTVRGRDWPVIEFCSRTVRVFVVSAQNSAPIAQRRVTDTGRFRFRWIPANKNIGPGRWRLVARMRCESGKDGSTVFVRGTKLIRVRP
jgi:hypothetical protein